MHLAVKIGGIPHLVKNERDLGHPAFFRELEVWGRPQGAAELKTPDAVAAE